MATPTITPSVAAPAATAPTPAPAAVPSTPVAPSTPVTSSPAVQPSSQSIEDQLATGWREHVAKDPTAAPEIAAPDAEAPAPAEGVVPAEAAPDAVAQPVADQAAADEDFPNLLGDIDVTAEASTEVGPAGFMAEASKAPEVKAWLDANPRLKNEVNAALRERAETREIRAIIPDAATAKLVSGAAATFQRIDNHFLSATTPEGAQAFLNEWVKEALITGEDGKPAMVAGPDGKMQYQVHPALTYTFDHIFNNKTSVMAGTVAETGKLPSQFAPIIDAFTKFAAKSGDDRYQSVAEFLKEVSTPSSSAPVEIPDELKPYAESLKAKEDALTKTEQEQTRQRSEAAKAANDQSVARTWERVDNTVNPQLEQAFAKSGLTKFESTHSHDLITSQVAKKLQKNEMFLSGKAAILQRPPSAEREKALAKHILTYTQQVIGPITAAVIREAKGGALARQTERQDKIAEQTTANREPQGTGVAMPQAVTGNPSQLRAAIVKEYKDAHGGSEPDLDYVTSQLWIRSRGGATRP